MTKYPFIPQPKLSSHLTTRVRGRFVRFHDPRYLSHDRFWATFIDGDFKWAANERFAGEWHNCGHYFARDVRGAQAEMIYYSGSNIPRGRVVLEVDLELDNVLDLTNETYLRQAVATVTSPDDHLLSRPAFTSLGLLMDQTTGGNIFARDIGRAAVEQGYNGVLYFGARAISDEQLQVISNASRGRTSQAFYFKRLRKDPSLHNLVAFSGLFLTTRIRSYRVGNEEWRKNPYFMSDIKELDAAYQMHGIMFDSKYQELTLKLTTLRQKVDDIVRDVEVRPILSRSPSEGRVSKKSTRSSLMRPAFETRSYRKNLKRNQEQHNKRHERRVKHGHHLVALCHGEAAKYAELDSSGRLLVSASDDGTARIWNVITETEMLTLRHDVPWSKPVNTAQFSADGTYILTAADDNVIHIWDAHTGKRLQVLIGHIDLVMVATWSPVDRRLIASASFDSNAIVWDREKERMIRVLPHGKDIGLFSVSWSADGSWLATTSHHETNGNGDVTIWDWRRSKVVATHPHVKSPIDAVFSPNGRQIASCSADGLTRIWKIGSDKPEKVLEGHKGSISRVRWSPNGNQLVTASDDGSAKIWSVNDGINIASFDHKASVYSATFSPDGKAIITAAKDGTVRLWVWDAAP